jgi:hypothetical protein
MSTTLFQISRPDAFARIIGILDQMGEGWKDADQVHQTVARIATRVRDTQTPFVALADQVQQMKVTYPGQSKGWAILGCLENVLRGGNRQGVN